MEVLCKGAIQEEASKGRRLKQKERTELRKKRKKAGKKRLGFGQLRKRSKIPVGSASDIVACHPKSALVLTRKHVSTLEPGRWINDECMNFYMALLGDHHLERCKKRKEMPSVVFFN